MPPGCSVEKVIVVGAPMTAAGYGAAMRATSAKYKVHLHPDVRLVHRGMLHELLRLFWLYPRLGLVAVRGATRLPGVGVGSVLGRAADASAAGASAGVPRGVR